MYVWLYRIDTRVYGERRDGGLHPVNQSFIRFMAITTRNGLAKKIISFIVSILFFSFFWCLCRNERYPSLDFLFFFLFLLFFFLLMKSIINDLFDIPPDAKSEQRDIHRRQQRTAPIRFLYQRQRSEGQKECQGLRDRERERKVRRMTRGEGKRERKEETYYLGNRAESIGRRMKVCIRNNIHTSARVTLNNLSFRQIRKKKHLRCLFSSSFFYHRKGRKKSSNGYRRN